MTRFKGGLLSAISVLLATAPALSDTTDLSTEVAIRVVETSTDLPVEARLQVIYPGGQSEWHRTDASGVFERRLNECSPSVTIRAVPVGYSHQTRTVTCNANPLEIALLRMQLLVEWSMLTEPDTQVALAALGSAQIDALFDDLLAAMETGQTGTALTLSRELQALTAEVPDFSASFSALSADLGLAAITGRMEEQGFDTLDYVPADLFFEQNGDVDWSLTGKGSDYLAEFQQQYGLIASGVLDDQTFDFIGNEAPFR